MLSHVLPIPDVSNSHLANNILLCCNFIAKACISSGIGIKQFRLIYQLFNNAKKICYHTGRMSAFDCVIFRSLFTEQKKTHL
jgi:hypothetical protein